MKKHHISESFKSKLQMPQGKIALGIITGCGAGVLLPFVLDRYIEPKFSSPLVPLIGPFGKWRTILPISTGILSLFFGFTKYTKSQATKAMLVSYGATAISTGVLNGAMDAGYLGASTARFQQRTPAMNRPIQRAYVAPVVVQAPQRTSRGGLVETHMTGPSFISKHVIRA